MATTRKATRGRGATPKAEKVAAKPKQAPTPPGPGKGSPKYRVEYLVQARKLAALGLNDAEVASFFEVSVRTFHRWKIAHPEFAAALVPGKAIAVENVAKSLYRQAMGYSHDAVKIMLAKDGTPVIIPYVEHVGPNVAASIFWLKNVDWENWKDRREAIVTGDGTVKIEGGLPEPKTEEPAPPVPAAEPPPEPDKPPDADG